MIPAYNTLKVFGLGSESSTIVRSSDLLNLAIRSTQLVRLFTIVSIAHMTILFNPTDGRINFITVFAWPKDNV
jgi:hypothetical protein